MVVCVSFYLLGKLFEVCVGVCVHGCECGIKFNINLARNEGKTNGLLNYHYFEVLLLRATCICSFKVQAIHLFSPLFFKLLYYVLLDFSMDFVIRYSFQHLTVRLSTIIVCLRGYQILVNQIYHILILWVYLIL